MNIRKGMWNCFVLISQTLNVTIYGGRPDETVSARSHRQGRREGNETWARRAERIDRLFRDPDHCSSSHQSDIDFAKMISDLEKPRLKDENK